MVILIVALSLLGLKEKRMEGWGSMKSALAQGSDLISLLPPVLSSISSTVGTATMNQN